MMHTRTLGRTGLQASEVGLGCEHLQGEPLETVQRVVDAALGGGINILDIFMSEPTVRTNLGIALKGRRESVLLQGHIGAGWRDGQYFRTRNLDECKHFFEDLLQRLQTSYIDIGMLHFVDTQADLEQMLQSGMLEYALQCKEKGICRAVGVSSHDPIVARQLVETGSIDVLMFSLNPAFDLLPPSADIDALFHADSYASQSAFTITPERLALYQACDKHNVAITVMKALGGGLMLKAETSPYGQAMSVTQCIHYALTRPAVASVLVGCKSEAEVEQAIAYESAVADARDYTAVLAASPRFSMQGKCMYCNHCLPCPSEIDIAKVNQYLDLAAQEAIIPATVREHYAAMPHNAADCIACGVCEQRCPFGVPVVERMQQAAQLFD